MQYTVSRYNVTLESDKIKHAAYLWNTASGSVLGLTEDGYDFFKEIQHTSRMELYLSRENYSGRELGYFDRLLEHGFIVPLALDEFEQTKIKRYQYLFDKYPSTISLTIATTMGCNYNCPYCFERGSLNHSERMTEEVADAIFRYVEIQHKINPNFKHLKVTWFGGEPLLNPHIIDYLSEKLISYCDDNGIKYNAGIITNGRLLCNEFSRGEFNGYISYMLGSHRVNTMQITVDGYAESYAEAKGATEEDFIAVMENIKVINDNPYFKDTKIQVRINLPTPSADRGYGDDALYEAKRLTASLMLDYELRNNVKVYLGFTRAPWGDQEEHHKEFLKLENRFINWFLYDAKFNPKSLYIRNHLPSPAACGNVAFGNLTINPNGDIVQCEHYTGNKDYKCGNIMDVSESNPYPYNYHTGILRYMIATNDKEMDECRQCPVYPICHGGCPEDILSYGGIVSCDGYRLGIYRDKSLSMRFKHGGK